MLSAHEILRFSANQAAMRFRHLGLYRDRTVIALRDHRPERNLWELVQTGGEVRLTRFPKLRPASFDGPAGNRFSARITPALFETVARVIPGSILTHYLMDDAVAKEVARLIDEHVPGTRPNVDVAKSLIVVTWSRAPYDQVLQACSPFNRAGLFTWKGETFDHKPLFFRRTG